MRKRNKGWMAGVFTASLILAGMSASAVHITIEGDPVVLPLAESIVNNNANESSEANDSNKEKPVVNPVTLSEFGLLGYEDETHIVIGTEEGIGYLTIEELSEAIPQLDITTLSGLPKRADVSAISSGSDAELIKKIQEGLIKLKFLEGTADGMFGAGSSAAVSEFQKAHHLEATGTAGVHTSWLIADLAGQDETIVISQGEALPEEKFSAIYNHTSADLSQYTDYKWKFSFDPFERVGILDPRVELGTLEMGSTDMDRMNVAVSLKVRAVMDYLTEEYELIPVFVVTYKGSSRPNINGAQFNVGNSTAYLIESVSESELEGINVVETAYITIDEEGMNYLKDENNKNGVLRILCQDISFDVPVDLSEIWCREQLPEVMSLDMAVSEELEVWN